MRGYVSPTDHGWYTFLRSRAEIGEVNFWRPGSAAFRALLPGEPFFFKLKGRHDAIGGFGLFARYARMPVWRAWQLFDTANGVTDQSELLRRLERLSGPAARLRLDHQIGCIAIADPVFFTPDEWVRRPDDWAPQVVSGRAYDLDRGEGRRVWRECLERAVATERPPDWAVEAEDRERVGAPQLIRPRLGQASFRLAVLDAYGGACAVTTEHSLPVLDAAHIRPWSTGGKHEVTNGLPLRSDLHRLFDLGYVTVRPDHRFAVSPRLREDYANGRPYYALEGSQIILPRDPDCQPEPDLLDWHGSSIFLA